MIWSITLEHATIKSSEIYSDLFHRYTKEQMYHFTQKDELLPKAVRQCGFWQTF